MKQQRQLQLTSEGTSGPQTLLRCRPATRDSSSAPTRRTRGGSTSVPSYRTRGGSSSVPSCRTWGGSTSMPSCRTRGGSSSAPSCRTRGGSTIAPSCRTWGGSTAGRRPPRPLEFLAPDPRKEKHVQLHPLSEEPLKMMYLRNHTYQMIKGLRWGPEKHWWDKTKDKWVKPRFRNVTQQTFYYNYKYLPMKLY
jgi:hypothetical protein